MDASKKGGRKAFSYLRSMEFGGMEYQVVRSISKNEELLT